MKTIAKLFLLLIAALVVHSCANAQGTPQFTIDGYQICILNNGPNDNCESLDEQLIVIDFINDDFILSGYDFPYPVPLSANMEVPYMEVHEDPIVALGINEAYIEIAFATSGSIAFNLNELGQVGLYIKNGKTAVMSKPLPPKEVTTKIFEENPCSTMSIYIDAQRNVMGERGNGVGTILVLSELQDSTLLLPMLGLKSGSILGLGDPFGNAPLHQMTHEAGIPYFYPEYVGFASEESGQCNSKHFEATTACCVSRFSQFARFFISNNYLIVRDLLITPSGAFFGLPHYFKIGTTRTDRVFLYRDLINHEIVVWKYGQCDSC